MIKRFARLFILCIALTSHAPVSFADSQNNVYCSQEKTKGEQGDSINLALYVGTLLVVVFGAPYFARNN